MGFDLKYGRVTTQRAGGDIPDDEIVVVFRARDVLLPLVMQDYLDACVRIGADDAHVQLVHDTRRAIITWQRAHTDRLRIPSSAAYRASIAGADADADRG